ncbi:MAG: response regulator [Deltaproteobacteria bacterium]|nr:response regulator [Deltaproteobacteria bacterium]
MEGKRILVVEDEKIVALDIARKLEKLGYSVNAMVSCGEAALESIQGDRPDLVLMDIELDGEMDGIQATAQIQSIYDIPVVYMTAYADEKTLGRAKVTGPFGYVLKPFETKDLQVAVELALYKHGMEAELLKARKLESVGILAGGIAHDFNNLLAVIMGYINLAKTQLKPEDDIYQNMEMAEKSCLQASELTKRLITFSRGGAPLRKATSLAGLLRGSVDRTLLGSDIRCNLSLPDDLWPVFIDEGQMKQVIHHLVMNAREAMPDGGLITISAENSKVTEREGFPLKEGTYVQCSFKDHGIGIPGENLSRIFDPYFTTKDRYSTKGMGLGLAICYSIIKSHDGLITAASEPGSGAAFTIYLPAAAPQSGVPAVRKGDATGNSIEEGISKEE